MSVSCPSCPSAVRLRSPNNTYRCCCTGAKCPGFSCCATCKTLWEGVTCQDGHVHGGPP